MGLGPVIPTISNTIGAVIIGWGLSCLFFGMLCIQVWAYYQRYTNDSTSYKVLVLSLWILEALHQAFVGHIAWYYIVDNRGSLLVLLNPPVWTLSVQTLLGALVGLIVKTCFGLRVWKFSKGNYLVTGLILGMALAQFATAVDRRPPSLLNNTASMTNVQRPASFHLRVGQADEITTLASTALSLGVATDIFTAASLSYFLHRMRTGYKKSDTLINRLIVYSVNTGTLTSVFSVAVLVAYNLMPDNLVFIALYFILSKLYANSCLATLNTRRFVHGRGTDREEATIPTFVMVANSIHRPRPQYQYPERDLEREELDEEDSEDQQKVSVAPDSDKVVHSAV
ncbi:hypothetical protein DFH94DRAFT_698856 [Russula ochroleuca]|uniref:DUF6534 domain-containing protein n=1 Tax=Russula ochroleuca TaxID=152965 RepID=A0A9P5JUI8_9AGAM|nr:hypothetical protein DFH94DRAFT_698856 [Russula ochroleuca]